MLIGEGRLNLKEAPDHHKVAADSIGVLLGQAAQAASSFLVEHGELDLVGQQWVRVALGPTFLARTRVAVALSSVAVRGTFAITSRSTTVRGAVTLGTVTTVATFATVASGTVTLGT